MGVLSDCGQWFGSDLQLAPDGDIATVSGALRSEQRVLRRLLTNPGDYLSHPTYGAGIGRWVGEIVNVAAITALVRGQMLLEASVLQNPPPVITVTAVQDGARVDIVYNTTPDQQIVTGFTVGPSLDFSQSGNSEYLPL